MIKRRMPKWLVAVFSVTRHEKAQVRPGRWANENQYPLSTQGFARAVRHGERFVEILKRNPSVWRQLKRRGLFYTGIASPMQRTVETDQSNFMGASAKLHDEGIKIQGHHHIQNPDLAFIKIDGRLRGYPKGKKATQNVLTKLAKYESGKPVQGFEPRAHLYQRMAQVGQVAKMVSKHGNEMPRSAPVLFVNLVSHGGERGIPLQVDYAAEALTGKPIRSMGGALQRGQSVMQLVFSDGSRKNILVRK